MDNGRTLALVPGEDAYEVMRLIAELKYFGRYITMTNEYELSFMHMNRKQYDKLCELIDTAQKLTRGEKR